MSQAIETTEKKRGSVKHEASILKTTRTLASGDSYILLLKDLLGDTLEPFVDLFDQQPNMLNKVVHGLLFGFDRKVANYTAESKELDATKVIELRLDEWKRLCKPTEKWIAEDKEGKGAVAKAEKEAMKASLEAEKAKNNKLIDLVIEIATCQDDGRKAELLAQIEDLRN